MNDPIHIKISKRLRGNRKLPNPFMKGNDFLQKLKEQPTLEDKRSQIVEANPLLLIFADPIKRKEQYGQDKGIANHV